MTFHEIREEFRAVRDAAKRNKDVERAFNLTCPDGNPVSFYEYLAEDVYTYQFRQKGLMTEELAIRQALFNMGLAKWHRMGKPYCKVSSAIGLMLMNTRLEFDAKFLMWPFDSFAIRFPEIDNPVVDYSRNRICRAMFVVGHTSEPDAQGHRLRRMQVWLDCGETSPEPILGYDQPLYGYIDLRLPEGQTLEEAFEASVEESFATGKNPTNADKEFMRRALALAVATSFFMVGNHKFVADDIPNRYKEAYHRAKKKLQVPESVEQAEKELKDILAKSKKLGFNGSILGQEIELPREIVQHIYEEGPQHQKGNYQMTWAHPRSGHIRLQPCGPREDPHIEVRFILPTIVRPDLPMMPCRGYIIKDEIIPPWKRNATQEQPKPRFE